MTFALFCKSFRGDISRFARLLASAERHGPEVRFVLSVPRSDRALFLDRFGTGRFELLLDEELIGREIPQSWRAQQLVKLYAGRAAFADAWLVVDSDGYFVRPLGESDFTSADGSVALVATPLLHLLDTEWESVVRYLDDVRAAPLPSAAELRAGPRPALRRPPLWQRWVDALRRPSAEAHLDRIQRFFGRSGPVLNFMPAPVWTRTSLATLESDLLEPLRLRFEDLIAFAPWEGVWVGEWELYRGLPGRHVMHPSLLHVGSDDAISRARKTGLTEAQIARRYSGLVLAARHQSIETLDIGSP